MEKKKNNQTKVRIQRAIVYPDIPQDNSLEKVMKDCLKRANNMSRLDIKRVMSEMRPYKNKTIKEIAKR